MNLSKIQKVVLIGTLLGDGYLERNGNNYRLQINHSLKQKDYVDWFYQIFKNLTRSEPRIIGRNKTNYRFRTITTTTFSRYHSLFYPNGRTKIVPNKIKQLLINPLALAVWFMDDGKRRPDCRGAFLDTICFTKSDQLRLIECLESNFGLEDLRLHWNGDGYHIYIPAKNADFFCSVIRRYIIPSMLYKLPLAL